jgi:guanylate kinase
MRKSCRTLATRLLTEFPHIYGLSLSHTTRKPRLGEEHGVHYWFISKEEMELKNAEGKFIELVTLFGNMYGTCMNSIDRVTEQGKVCIMGLEMEVTYF